MVHVHGAQVQQLVAQTRGLAPERLVAVPIDVGKGSAAALVCDFTGELLAGRFQFALTRVGVAGLVGQVQAVQAARPVELVRVGIEAAGHYHRPLCSAGVLPADWQLVEYNPAHVAAQRWTNGQRGVKTDAVDLAAIADLLVAGRGLPVGRADPAMVELAGLVAHRARRVQVRSALKNQLLGQLDRCFPGLDGCLADLLGTKVGRLLVAEFADPARLAHLGVARFRAFAARRGVLVAGKVAERLVAAARVALPTDQAAVARRVLADDLQLLVSLDGQIGAVERRLGVLVAATPSPCCAACRAGPPCGSPPTRLLSGNLPAGRQPGSCTGPPGSPPPSTSRPGGAATAPSAEKARSRCAGRCGTLGLGCGTATRRPAPTPPACAPGASLAG